MSSPQTDDVSAMIASDRISGERGAAALRNGVDAARPVAQVYFALLKSINHDALLAAYAGVHGEEQGAIELSNQFGRIFEEARTRSGVLSESFARHIAGAGYFTTARPDDAEALAVEMIRVAEAQNAATPSPELHKNIAAVIVAVDAPSPSPEHARENFAAALDSTGMAEFLTADMHSGEVRLTGAVHDALSPARSKCYERVLDPGDRLSGGAAPLVWRRQVISSASLAPSITRAVMCVDMCRFSRIQANMKLMNKASGVSTLRDQIVSIIGEGFRVAGAASYERYMHKWGGDGGIFFFEDPALAHHVAVAILKQAEEQQNKEARESNCEDAMRCFRIGIDFGRLDRGTGGDDYAGEPLTRSTRLESGGPSGEIRVSEEFYQRLDGDLRRAYGDKEPIFGKEHDTPKGIGGRRLAVAERALWAEISPRDNKAYPPIKLPNADFPVAPDQLVAQELCFIISPLGDDVPRVTEVFSRLIAPVCERAGFMPRRATDIPGDRKSIIAENLWNAPLVIAYLGNPAHWNYNVILEVGIRLATGLPLIMLSDALDDGREPDYQRLLPFQIVHHNVITVPADPAQKLQKVLDEIGNSRARSSGAWESPNPVMEFRYATFDDVIITDANETARAVFGSENVRAGQCIENLRKSLAERTDPVQAEARSEEQMTILDALLARAVRGRAAAANRNWRPPKARIPIVFKDAPIDPDTKKPIGYLPIILRYHFDHQYTRVRYLYLRVSEAMQRPEGLPYYVCDV